MPLVLVKSDPKAREKPCLRCGYSLRKLGDTRNCPECGLSVWVSLNQNDSLDWSRPDWLRRIGVGAFVMAASQGLGIMAGVLLAMPFFGYWVSTWIIAVYLIAISVGMVLLAWPEKRYPDKLKGFRWFVTGAAIAGALVGLGIAALAALGRSAVFQWQVLGRVVEIVMLVGAVATLLYIRKLAHRLGAHRLSKALGWLLLLPLINFMKAFPLWGISMAFGFCGMEEVLAWLYVPISLGILIYLGIGFQKAATAAEVNWASAG